MGLSLYEAKKKMEIPAKETRQYCVLITLVIAASAYYLPWIGFYSDDWAFLGVMHTAGSSLAQRSVGRSGTSRRHAAGATRLAGGPVTTWPARTLALSRGEHQRIDGGRSAPLPGAARAWCVTRYDGGGRPALLHAAPLFRPIGSGSRPCKRRSACLCYLANLYALLRGSRSPGARGRWWILATVAGVLCVCWRMRCSCRSCW